MLLLNPFITIIAGKYWDFEVNMSAGIPFHKDHTQTCHHLSFIVFCALNLVQSLHILLKSRKAKTFSKKLKLLSLACLSTSSSEYYKLQDFHDYFNNYSEAAGNGEDILG